MLLHQRNYLADDFNPNEHLSFEEYLEEQTDNLEVFLQIAARDSNHPIRRRMDGASEEDIEAEMQRWRNCQIDHFQDRLWQQERTRRLKRRLRREATRCSHAEERMEATQAELSQARADLAVERDYSSQLKEQWRCRECNARRWEG